MHQGLNFNVLCRLQPSFIGRGFRSPILQYWNMEPIKKKIIIIILAVLGLGCCARTLCGCCNRCLSLLCVGLSLLWLLCCRAQALDHRLSITGSRSQAPVAAACELCCGIWDSPGPWVRPLSPALAGGFLTTGPPQKPRRSCFKCCL